MSKKLSWETKEIDTLVGPKKTWKGKLTYAMLMDIALTVYYAVAAYPILSRFVYYIANDSEANSFDLGVDSGVESFRCPDNGLTYYKGDSKNSTTIIFI